jgi:fibro-slime domain-containing protein
MTRCGQGRQVCADGVLQPCDAPVPVPPTWTATVRDFSDTHPDFETAEPGVDPGIVAPDLGPDDKPVYAGNPTTPTTSGKTNFDQWYRDVPVPDGGPPVNARADIPFPLLPSPTDPTSYQFVQDFFFPIDDGSQHPLLGNMGQEHNFDFTLEVSGQFLYNGGETFRFASDDDLWVFLNRKLAVDNGGIHARRSATVDLDAAAGALGIVRGGVYSFHLFFAERHLLNSVLEVIVPAADFSVCP